MTAQRNFAHRASDPRARSERDWYSVSVSSLRRGALLLGLVLALIGGSLLLQLWEHRSLRERAEAAIADAAELAHDIERRDDFEQLRIDHFAAWEDLDAARAELAAERYAPALHRAENSLGELQRLLQVEQGPSDEKSRFMRVQGGVEYRRGERGAWKRARKHDTLNPGDWVKTSTDGTAEIRFPDGSKYVLRPNTMVHLGSSSNETTGGEEQVADIVFGWVELNTAESGGKVTTPKSQATVRRDSEALVSFDRDRGAGQFAAFKGTMEVTPANGQSRRVEALQQVEQVGDLLSSPKVLPGRPELLGPDDDQQIDFAAKELSLAWSPVTGARQYALHVSRSPLFTANVITDDNRRKTTARLGIQGEGIFYWQVAAVDRDGARGPWSDTRTFRVAAMKSATGGEDQTPPELEIEDVQAFGSLVIVNGRTEPGAKVTINDEPVSVQINGSFSKTIQMTQVGFAFVKVVAVDAWDNPTEVKRRVFIDAL